MSEKLRELIARVVAGYGHIQVGDPQGLARALAAMLDPVCDCLHRREQHKNGGLGDCLDCDDGANRVCGSFGYDHRATVERAERAADANRV